MILPGLQIVTLKRGQNIRYRPYVFTEHAAVLVILISVLVLNLGGLL